MVWAIVYTGSETSTIVKVKSRIPIMPAGFFRDILVFVDPNEYGGIFHRLPSAEVMITEANIPDRKLKAVTHKHSTNGLYLRDKPPPSLKGIPRP